MPNITRKCFSCVWTKCAYYYISFCYCQMSSLRVRNFILEMIGYPYAWHIHMYTWGTLLCILKTANFLPQLYTDINKKNAQFVIVAKICMKQNISHWHGMIWYDMVWYDKNMSKIVCMLSCASMKRYAILNIVWIRKKWERKKKYTHKYSVRILNVVIISIISGSFVLARR